MNIISNYKFTETDQAILREAITHLSFIDRQIIINRFWENFSIQEIADTFEMTWSEVDQSIEESLIKLKDLCLLDEAFSLNQDSLCSG